MGRLLFTPPRLFWEMLVRKEWLGCRHDTSPMINIPESTLVWVPYIIFFGFDDIKIHMFYVFKIICIIKGKLVVSNFVMARRCTKRFSIAREF